MGKHWWTGLTPIQQAAELLRQTAARLRKGKWKEGAWGTGDYRCLMGWLEAEMAFSVQQVEEGKFENVVFFGYDGDDESSYEGGLVAQPYQRLNSSPEALQKATTMMADVLREQMPEFVATAAETEGPLTAEAFAELTLAQKEAILITWNDAGAVLGDDYNDPEARGKEAVLVLYEKAAARLAEIVE